MASQKSHESEGDEEDIKHPVGHGRRSRASNQTYTLQQWLQFSDPPVTDKVDWKVPIGKPNAARRHDVGNNSTPMAEQRAPIAPIGPPPSAWKSNYNGRKLYSDVVAGADPSHMTNLTATTLFKNKRSQNADFQNFAMPLASVENAETPYQNMELIGDSYVRSPAPPFVSDTTKGPYMGWHPFQGIDEEPAAKFSSTKSSDEMSLKVMRTLGKALGPNSDLKYLNENVCKLIERRMKPATKPLFDVKIDDFNFTEIDLSPNAFPRFCCQFADENYQRVEQLAWRGFNSTFEKQNNGMSKF